MTIMDEQFIAFERAVETAGSLQKFADICGCAKQNIHALISNRRRLPAEYVLSVEAATGVSRHDLRPDIYPRECAA